MRKKILGIQLTQTLFIAILFVLVFLEKNGIIYKEGSFIGSYAILSLIYWVIIIIPICLVMKKYQEKEKILLIGFIIISVEILLVAIFCGCSDRKIDIINFSKNCSKTIATIYDVEKDVQLQTGIVDGRETHYTARITYYFEYNVNNRLYKDKFGNSNTSERRDEAERKVTAIYKAGDEFTIYYNNNNPKDWRRDLNYASEGKIKVLIVAITVLRIIGLGKAIIDYEKEKNEVQE